MNDAFWWLSVLGWCAISLLIGAIIGRYRGRVGAGIALALLLGPIGWLLVFLGPDRRRKCPRCAEVIQQRARLCPHCRTDLTAPRRVVEDPVEAWVRRQA